MLGDKQDVHCACGCSDRRAGDVPGGLCPTWTCQRPHPQIPKLWWHSQRERSRTLSSSRMLGAGEGQHSVH